MQQVRTVRLKKRADFLRAARGARAAMPGLVLQCRASPETAEAGAVRIGFTATKKLGGAGGGSQPGQTALARGSGDGNAGTGPAWT